MIAIRRILCPVDFSDHSRRALDHAIALARCYKSTVTVLYVFSAAPIAAVSSGPTVFQPIVLTPLDREQLVADVKTFAEREGAPGVTIEAVASEGYAASEILEQAARMQADLLVIGTHGRSGFDRLLLGSVAEKVLRKASCPVMTVPTRLPNAVPAGPVLYKRILCPVDFSESSLHALKYATSLAQEADAQLTVVHAIERDFEYASGFEYTGMTVEAFVKEREDALQRRLQELAGSVPDSCRADSIMTRGTPWREILRTATERSSDLLVMGVQGRGAADLMFFGSTTQQVVRRASCPVLTLRHA